MSIFSKKDETLSPEEQATTEQFAADVAVLRAEQDARPNGQHHSPEPFRALAELLSFPQLADVTWSMTGRVPCAIAGSLTIPAEPELQSMTPERARMELAEFGAYLNGGSPATERTVQEGKRTRVIVSGRLYGAEVELAILMPPMDPLTATAPATTEWAPVDVIATDGEHPYIGPQFERGPVAVPAAEKPKPARRRKTQTEDETTGDAA